MLTLFDRYDHATRELMQSLATAGIECTPVVVEYGGELPDGVLSPFVACTGLAPHGRPLFFDEVPVPPWSEIRQGREPYGEVLLDGRAIGRIHYEANSFREVERVDWLLPDGSVGHADHYDRHGNRYATTHYDDGAAYQTVYRGASDTEIEVHHGTRGVTVRSPGRLLAFPTLTAFVSWFLDEQGVADDRVLINSLSTPLLVMRRRGGTPRTTLWWQEPMPGGVPGNMALELEQPRALTSIVFSDERLLARVAAAHPGTPLELGYLSHLGQFADHRGFDARRVFTLTNSDELPWLEALLEALPDVAFSVAALTLMSERLHGLARRHPNLTLIPTATQRRIHEELARASVYLDVNAGAHVLDVVKAAYYLDLVVLAAAPVAKSPDHALVSGSVDELASRLTAVVAGPSGRTAALEELHRQAGPLSTPADYARRFGRPLIP